MMELKRNLSSQPERRTFIERKYVLKLAEFMARGGGGGTLGISGWGWAAVTLEPLAYTRASSAEFC